ncbi:MAG: TonB-dependent receptor [Gammaproteobacteria bacterium]|nr:TonB-dependent receptor [Gammaproteobacteria bacterium]MCY4281527.1 TonB-dependent receptor [Gammaproteobacteria bacterium]MCY4337421.1 TonB-dependent receptor [Gammaproteobacteria bacterium]
MKKILGFLFSVSFFSPPVTSVALADGLLEEVVVTARKREESIMDAPLSVSALSASELARFQVDDLGDIQNIVPNLSLNMGDAANAIIYIRGVGQRDSLSFADPGVGVYLDDVYMGRAQGSFLDVIDVERIEVLRGPQGTLYGRNTIGGAIKYVSAGPTDTPFLEGEASIGNYSEYMLKATWSGPLSADGSLLGRLSLAHVAHDGYNDNTFAGAVAGNGTDGDKRTFAGRLHLQYLPTDDLSFDLTLDRSVNDPERSITPARVTPGPTLVQNTAGYQATGDPFEIEADFNDVERLKVEGIGLTVDYQAADAVSLKSITSFRQLEHETNIDLDGTGFNIFGVFVDQDQEQFSQELQLSYDAGGALKALAGAYYFSEDDITPDGINNSEPVDFTGGAGLFFSPYETVSENDQSVEAVAVFGEASWFITAALELTVGARYTHESKELKRRACQALGAPLSSIDECNPPLNSTNPFALNLDLNEDFSKVTPKAGISYRFNDVSMAYFTYARGFKSGGFDGRIGYNGASDGGAVNTQALPYNPEIADTYEIGWKSSLADGRLRLSAAAFYNDYQDLQLSSFSATSTGGFATVFTNAGKAENWGLEAELLANPAPNFLVSLNVGYLEAEYKEFINSANQNVSDALTPINSPELTGNLGFQYRHPLGFAYLLLGADISYRSDYFVDINNLEALWQDDFTLVNASIGLEAENGKWDVSFGVKNLTDEEYITHGFDLTAFPGVGLAYYGQPLTYRFQARYRFF